MISLTLTHYQPGDSGYSFGASFHYRLIRESLILPPLIFATFLAAGMGVGLYAGQLIHEYIRYINGECCCGQLGSDVSESYKNIDI